MALSVIHRYKHTDETGATGLNGRDAAKNNKGIIRGDASFPGTVSNPSNMTLRVAAFKAVSFDGMIVKSDATIDFTLLADTTYWIVLHAKHGTTVGGETLEVRALTNSVYSASPSQSEYVVIAKITIPSGASSILSSYISYEDADLLDKNTRRPYRGTVNTKADLPTDGNVRGDMYVVLRQAATDKDSGGSLSGDRGFQPTLWIYHDDNGGSGTPEWYPINPHHFLLRVKNDSGATRSADTIALLNGFELNGTNNRSMPKIVEFVQVSNPGTRANGRPVFVPFDIADGEEGWVFTEGMVPYSSSFTAGEVLYFNGTGLPFNTEASASHMGFPGPAGIALGTSSIWFDPGRSFPTLKGRYGRPVKLAISDATVTGTGVAVGDMLGSTNYPKGVEFPTRVTGHALWAVNLAEFCNDSAYDGVQASGTGNKFIRVRFATVYEGTDVANVRFAVRVISQTVSGGAILPQNTATAGRFDEEIVDVATTAVANTHKNVTVHVGDGLFIFSVVYFLDAVEDTDWITLKIERQGAEAADTASDSMWVTAVRVDFDMKPIDRVP